MWTGGRTDIHEANFSQSRERAWKLMTDVCCHRPIRTSVTHASSIEKVSFTLVCEIISEGRLSPLWVGQRMYCLPDREGLQRPVGDRNTPAVPLCTATGPAAIPFILHRRLAREWKNAISFTQQQQSATCAQQYKDTTALLCCYAGCSISKIPVQ